MNTIKGVMETQYSSVYGASNTKEVVEGGEDKMIKHLRAIYGYCDASGMVYPLPLEAYVFPNPNTLPQYVSSLMLSSKNTCGGGWEHVLLVES